MPNERRNEPRNCRRQTIRRRCPSSWRTQGYQDPNQRDSQRAQICFNAVRKSWTTQYSSIACSVHPVRLPLKEPLYPLLRGLKNHTSAIMPLPPSSSSQTAERWCMGAFPTLGPLSPNKCTKNRTEVHSPLAHRKTMDSALETTGWYVSCCTASVHSRILSKFLAIADGSNGFENESLRISRAMAVEAMNTCGIRLS